MNFHNLVLMVTAVVLSAIQVNATYSQPPGKLPKKLPTLMKAVGVYEYLPVSNVNSLIDLELNLPVLQGGDVLVEVKATSVNPIDVKVRSLMPYIGGAPRILGWDGAGVVVDKGIDVKCFDIGDEVIFTGYVGRNGSNAQYVAIDEAAVGPKPKSLTFEQAAAMPLTSLAAYESLYDRLLLSEKDVGKSLLIVNSAGGMGAIASQLAKNLGLIVIGTASRPETEAYSLQHGADIVLNHKEDLLPQLKARGYEQGVDYILVNYDPFPYWKTLMEAIKPQGKICLIGDSSAPVDLSVVMDKSVTLVYEMMFTRIKYNTEDKYRQQEILKIISDMLDKGQLKTTLNEVFSPINAINLREAHRLMEGKRMIGKLVLTGF